MTRRSFSYLKTLMTFAIVMSFSLTHSEAAYNGECWVVSGGDTVRKIYSDGSVDPAGIPGLTQAQAAEVDPKNGVVWISVSAANAAFRYDPAATDENAMFKTISGIPGARSISINPGDGTAWIGGKSVVKKISRGWQPSPRPNYGRSRTRSLCKPDGWQLLGYRFSGICHSIRRQRRRCCHCSISTERAEICRCQSQNGERLGG